MSKTYFLSQIAEIVNGSTPSSENSDYYGGDIVWATPNDLSKQRTKYFNQSERMITQLGYDSCSTKMIPSNNILLTSRAPIGLIAINKIECCTNQGFKSLIVDKNICDTEFLYYYLIYHMPEIEALGSGTTFKEVSKSSLEKYEVKLPDLKEQKQIASILSLLDSKITLNNRINSTLESMAKTLYDYWLLQFDFPDENGRPYKSSGGKMVWNDELKREIPEGWEVKNLIDNPLTEVIKPGVERFEKKNYLATANVNGSTISDGEWIQYENRESRANMQPKGNSIWFAKMKNSIKHITVTNKDRWMIDKYIFSTGFCGLTCNDYSLPYIYCFINSPYFEIRKDVLAHGATQEAVNNSDLERVSLIIPKEDVLKSFSDKIYPYLEMLNSNAKENQKLAELRDFLLPLLMNGQVGFKEE